MVYLALFPRYPEDELKHHATGTAVALRSLRMDFERSGRQHTVEYRSPDDRFAVLPCLTTRPQTRSDDCLETFHLGVREHPASNEKMPANRPDAVVIYNVRLPRRRSPASYSAQCVTIIFGFWMGFCRSALYLFGIVRISEGAEKRCILGQTTIRASTTVVLFSTAIVLNGF